MSSEYGSSNTTRGMCIKDEHSTAYWSQQIEMTGGKLKCKEM